jgi:predicted methyltransferase
MPKRIPYLMLAVALAAAAPTARGLAQQQSAAAQPAREHVNVPREQWQRVGDILTELGARRGSRIADVGAGAGYFTTRLSKAVESDGRVYAVDVNPISLRELRDALGTNYPNVELVRGDEDNPRLPPATLDAVLIVNAYHEFAEYGAMLGHLRAALKPGGRLVLVEPIPRAEDTTRAAQAKRHAIAIEFAEADLRAAGFEVVKTDTAFVTRPMHMGEATTPPGASPAATDWLLVARRPADGSAYAPSSDQR